MESINNGGYDNNELEKSKAYIVVEILEYVPKGVAIKTIIKKTTGSVSVMAFDSGKGLSERTSPFDTFIQIIEGRAEVIIDSVSNYLEMGSAIIIPAHQPNFIRPNEPFKMITTTIKSGYE